MALVNRAYADKQGLGVYLRYRVAELPYLVQWKMMGLGHYICGLEPSTNLVEDRAKERQEGRLQFLVQERHDLMKLKLECLLRHPRLKGLPQHLSASWHSPMPRRTFSKMEANDSYG